MAKCKSCGIDIPDGAEYCEECKSKLNTAKDSESYLDSLLNAVMTEEPKPREIAFPKRETSSLVSVPEKEEAPVEAASNIEETEELFVPEMTAALEAQLEETVADDWMNEFLGTQEEVLKEEVEEEASDDWMNEFFGGAEEPEATSAGRIAEPEHEPEEEPPMEDTFGMFFDGNSDLPDLKSYSIFDDVDERDVDRMLADDLGQDSFWNEDEPEEEDSLEEEMEEVPASEVGDIEDVFGLLEDERGADAPEELEMATPDVISAAEFAEMSDTFSGIVETPEDEVPVSEFGDVTDLFGGDGEEPVAEAVSASEFGDFADLFGGDGEEPVAEAVPASEFGDFADLFGGDGEEPVAEAVPTSELNDFADLFGGGEAESTGETAATDVSDMSGMLDSLEETNTAESSEHSMDDFADLFAGFDGSENMFEFGAEPEELEQEPQEETVVLSSPKETEQGSEQEEGSSKKSKKAKKEKKKSGGVSKLYHKLFDNVAVDPSKIKPKPTKEEIEAQKKEKQEAKERSKEEKEALLAEKKEQEKQVKLEKQRIAKEAKAEKKARKLEEAKLLLEEMESTRINRAGASIVFIFFAMIAVLVVMGTSIFSYSLSIKNAEYEFDRDEYTLAYNEIYGLEIKNEDLVLYDRIMTVMYVQKQLNSYYNYYGMDDKPKALDSLLKGLQRYEKYIELAVDLDVDSDLDSVRKKILKEISTVFLLNEQQAMEIIQSDSRAEYSQRVYDAVEGLEE